MNSILGFVADAQGEYKSRPSIHMDAFRWDFFASFSDQHLISPYHNHTLSDTGVKNENILDYHFEDLVMNYRC